ncbi:hypothetical protein VPH35_055036 [Triticum aestivum]|uniref:Uncharacterized protein n=1 Tax=Triticum aestivum TaxID=4565 RepID=A0A077RYG1_WHEAT|nr:unnamed protein product [Triticum aestivum]
MACSSRGPRRRPSWTWSPPPTASGRPGPIPHRPRHLVLRLRVSPDLDQRGMEDQAGRGPHRPPQGQGSSQMFLQVSERVCVVMMESWCPFLCGNGIFSVCLDRTLWLMGVAGSIAYNWSRSGMKTSVKLIHDRAGLPPKEDNDDSDGEDSSNDVHIRLDPYRVFDRYFREKDDNGTGKGEDSRGRSSPP